MGISDINSDNDKRVFLQKREQETYPDVVPKR